MYLREITEGVASVWGRKNNRVVRKYRCTSGPRKGRVVSKPSTCTAPRNVSRSVQTKVSRRKQASQYKVKVARTKRTNPASARLKKFNVRRKTPFRKTHRGKRLSTKRRKL